MNETSSKKEFMEKIAVKVGRPIGSIIKIEGTGEDFDINTRAETKCKELGFKVGTMERDKPRALKSTYDQVDLIGKWCNIPVEAYPAMDGILVCDDFRNGFLAYIVLFENRDMDEELA